MKRNPMFFLILACTILTSCAEFQKTENNAIHKTLAYASGKAFAITINKLTAPCTEENYDCVDANLTNAWVNLMERNGTLETIPTVEMIAFYNECVQILASPVKDPYGLMGDLSTLLMIYSAEFDNFNGYMVAIRPVPIEIMRFFEMGYDSGRKIARKDNLK